MKASDLCVCVGVHACVRVCVCVWKIRSQLLVGPRWSKSVWICEHVGPPSIRFMDPQPQDWSEVSSDAIDFIKPLG